MTTATAELWLTSYTLTLPPGRDLDYLRPRPRQLHQTIMSLFGPPLTRYGRAEKHILWRLERSPQGAPRMLIQSTEPPTEHAASLPHITVKPVRGYRAALHTGRRVRYQVQISAQRQYSGSSPRSVLTSPSEAIDLWHRRAARAGLELDPTALAVERIHPQRPRKGTTPDPALFPSDLFSGQAVITDPEALWSTVQSGIGKSKTWGCGLLSIMASHD